MKGKTPLGNTFKTLSPSQSSVESVPSSKNIDGQTALGNVASKKSLQPAAFSTPKTCGSVKGQTGVSV